MSAVYSSPSKVYSRRVTIASTVKFMGMPTPANKLQRFTNAFQELVRAYKNLPAPKTIEVELDHSLVIEAQETHAPEIDPNTIRQHWRLLPGTRKHVRGKGKKPKENRQPPFLILDFRYVKVLVPQPPPRVATTYNVRGGAAVENKWHFMLKKCPVYGLGIFIHLPGTSFRYFIDMVITGDLRSSYPSDGASFEFPLDLIAWQLFDFFLNRIADEKFSNGKGLAPSSLHCADETLSMVLSGLFFNWDLPKQRSIKVSSYKGIPEEYEEQLIGLPNRDPSWAPLRDLGTVALCRGCYQLFVRACPEQDMCRSCNERVPSSSYRSSNANWGTTTDNKTIVMSDTSLYFSKHMKAQIDKRKISCDERWELISGKRLRKEADEPLLQGLDAGGGPRGQ